MNNISKALLFAREAHGNQLYSGNLPYVYHLEKTLKIAKLFYTDESILIASVLHDTIEDTQTKLTDIIDHFGYEVANLVYLVSNKPGENRKEKHCKTYPHINNNHKAVAIKLCDRISNINECIKTEDSRLKMYLKEHDYFYSSLCSPGKNQLIWCMYLSIIESVNNIP